MSSLIETLIKKDRTYRRFDESVAIDRLQILRWLDVVRQTPSARNIQPLKYIIITDEALCHEITELQHWAAMLPEWDGPAVGERPRAYLLQLIDTDIAPAARFDEGIQLQTLGLLATDAGYGVCIFAGHGKGEITRIGQWLAMSPMAPPIVLFRLKSRPQELPIKTKFVTILETTAGTTLRDTLEVQLR